ncbi:MAG TPA: FlgD immunoglobulin-like domain containing protein, partial [Anseongella sp.]|nr:FlgD immunoglobulin-like domain containing protein [Anseongella sp.]
LLQINYRFPENNLVASIRIFDLNGYMVKNLGNNRLLGTSGSFTWDGRDQSGAELRMGTYVVYMEVFSAKGWTAHFKEACVLARRR